MLRPPVFAFKLLAELGKAVQVSNAAAVYNLAACSYQRSALRAVVLLFDYKLCSSLTDTKHIATPHRKQEPYVSNYSPRMPTEQIMRCQPVCKCVTAARCAQYAVLHRQAQALGFRRIFQDSKFRIALSMREYIKNCCHYDGISIEPRSTMAGT